MTEPTTFFLGRTPCALGPQTRRLLQLTGLDRTQLTPPNLTLTALDIAVSSPLSDADAGPYTPT